MTINANIRQILKMLSDMLYKNIEKCPVLVSEERRDYLDYLNEVNEILLEAQDESSFYNAIPKEQAATFITNHIFQNFPGAMLLTVTEKTIFLNTVQAHVVFYLESLEEDTSVDEDSTTTSPEEDEDKPSNDNNSTDEPSTEQNPGVSSEDDLTDAESPKDATGESEPLTGKTEESSTDVET
jgi:hypothetical protein